MKNQENGVISLYGCGGTGIAIASSFEDPHTGKGFADFRIHYVDTSQSALTGIHNERNTYLINSTDGAGGIRGDVVEVVSERTGEILTRLPPGDLNVVISSAGGGSSSVIAPLLVTKLLEQDKNVIVLLVGDTFARKDAENTIKTLMSYENIAQSLKMPVIMAYEENSVDAPRSVVDSRMQALTLTLAMLYSKQNKNLDSRDLYNWLRFHRATNFEPMLASLQVIKRGQTLDRSTGTPISIATLSANQNDYRFDQTVDFHRVGFIPEGMADSTIEQLPYHFVITEGGFENIAKNIREKMESIDTARDTAIKRKPILTEDLDGGKKAKGTKLIV